jgi:cytochrome c556
LIKVKNYLQAFLAISTKEEVMRSRLIGAVCGLMLIAVAGLAFAKFATTDDAINYRKAVMTIIGEHFAQLAAVVTGQSPYRVNSVSHHTMVVRTMAELPWDSFMMPGSQKGKTTLKKSAIEEKDDFMNMAGQFEKLTRALDEAAKTGNLDAVKVQFGEVAKSCKDCHMAYRKL